MNRWYFWVLAPVMLAGAIIVVATARPSSMTGAIIGYVFSAALLLSVLGFANPVRFRWALRAVAGIVVLAGVAYFVDRLQALLTGEPLGVSRWRSAASLVGPILFLFVIGIPALRYLIYGVSESAVDVLAAPERCQNSESSGLDEDDQD